MMLTRLLELLTAPIRWLRGLRDRNKAGRQDRAIQWHWVRVSEDPDDVTPRTVYLIGEGATLWKAVLRCPCDCDAIIQLSLHRIGRPRWVAIPHRDGRVTLRPSVWRTTGCRSHFVLERGLVSFVQPGPECRGSADQ